MFNAFIKFSLDNRFIILVFAAIILVVGTYQTTQLPVDVLPDLSQPRVIVMVEWVHKNFVGICYTGGIATFLQGRNFMQSESPHFSRRELLHAKLDALLDECDLIPSNPQTLDNLELFFLDKGRQFLQETFQEQLQERVKQVETTPEAKQCHHCKKNAILRGENEKLSARVRIKNLRP